MKNRYSAFTLIELLVVMAILAILAALALGAVGGCSTSNGARVGVVSKFSSKGNIHKSFEGELLLGGARSGENGIVANVWPFSVSDSKVVEQVEAAQDSGHRVKLFYNQTLMHNPLVRDTSYYVTKLVDLQAPTNSVAPEK